MKVTRTREIRVNMGNFEHVILTAGAEADTKELGTKTEAEAFDLLSQILDNALAPDIARAANSTALPADDTFINTWKEQ